MGSGEDVSHDGGQEGFIGAFTDASTKLQDMVGDMAERVFGSQKVTDIARVSEGKLANRAGESKSPYVRAHRNNPVAWQLWGDEAISLARKQNKLLFISIGYAACHWCHVMEKESFENEEVAELLNTHFIPIKIDREERPDIDRIYMNFVQATTGSGGWPLNVFATPTLEPVFGGTYWPGPQSATPQLALEDQVDFLSILRKLSDVWKEQEDRCRQDAASILKQLRDFAAEGTFGSQMGEGPSSLDMELLEEAYQHFSSTFDLKQGGFGGAPKFPTPTKLSFLLSLLRYPVPVIDIVGEKECLKAQQIAITTLKAMARGGIHDQIGHGFARYSVTSDWSLPHFEKMLYDNAQLLHVYLDGFLSSSEPELLGTVYDLVAYLTEDALAAPSGGFYSSEDADSYYRKGDTEKREGAFYVWTRRELDTLLAPGVAPLVATFWAVSEHGNVEPENDAHDEFINQNVLKVASMPKALAAQFGVGEDEVINTIKSSREKLRKHREAERVRPSLDDKIVAGWNGIAIGALARTSKALQSFDSMKSEHCINAAKKAAHFLQSEMWNGQTKILKRVWREGVSDTEAFADDYAFLIEGLIDLYEATFQEEYLKWADELQASQISLFYDATASSISGTSSHGGFFSTAANAPHTILRLKDGMDAAEPSTNGTSACNLYRLSSLLNDEHYAHLAEETCAAFESEMLQYPWLFASFMPAIVAGRLGIKGKIIVVPDTKSQDSNSPWATQHSTPNLEPREGLTTTVRIDGKTDWLKERNILIGALPMPKNGKQTILICENGACREEGMDLDTLAADLPETTAAAGAVLSDVSSSGADAVIPPEAIRIGEMPHHG